MAEYVDYVLRKKKREVSDTTYSAYFYRAKRIIDYLGEMRIKDVNVTKIESFLDDLINSREEPKKEENIRVIVCKPHQRAEEKTIKNQL